jgi:RHS repeat-associated protein
VELLPGFETATATDELLVEIQAGSGVLSNDYPGGQGSNDIYGAYRYGFNGKENDNEVKGAGNQLDFGARIYDSRLGRWFSPDPLEAKFTSFSPYNYSLNSPIIFKDIDGRDIVIAGKNGSSITITTSLINITVDGSSYLPDFGGFYTFNGEKYIELGLDLGGIFDPSGSIDVIATIYYSGKGEYFSAFISGVSVIPGGDLAKIAKIEKYLETIRTALKVFNNNAVEKIALTYAQRTILYEAKRRTAGKLLGIALEAKGLIKKVGDQAHHLIPVNLIKNNEYLGNLVANGWDINNSINGKWLASAAENGWKKAFHGNAPAYDDWIELQINNYVKEKGEKELTQFIENELLPKADRILDKMYEIYKKTGKNMNDQFKELMKPK